MEFEVGKTFWWVPLSQHQKGRSVEVTKVGRKWAQLSNGNRADIETGEVDGAGYTSPGSLWESEEAHERYMALRASWYDFVSDLRNAIRPPAGITVDEINAIRLKLGLAVYSPA